MKKTIILILFIILFYSISALTIPENAIRMRIIPNSNTEYDQTIKIILKEELELDMYNLLKDTKDIAEARNIISRNLESIDQKVNTILTNNNYDLTYNLNYGLNYFPEKKHLGTTYDAGMYESLVITLGEGKGDNWWCILFPPFCLLEAEESEEVEYKWFIKELFKKYL